VRPPALEDAYAYVFNVDTAKWEKWTEINSPFEMPPGKLNFSEIVVPTTDSVRNTYLLDLLLSCNNHTLMVGETGTGKTMNISQYLLGQAQVRGKTIDPSLISLSITFSATASANMTQDLLDSKFDKRKRGVFGPPAGKRCDDDAMVDLSPCGDGPWTPGARDTLCKPQSLSV
jgi:dynein heavy chain